MRPPERKHTLALKLGADTFEDLLHQLDELVNELLEEGSNGPVIMGGASFGLTFCHIVDSDKTHARYVEQLAEYLAERGRGT